MAVPQLIREACSSTHRVSKATVIASTTGRTKAFLETLSTDQWDVNSFNPKTREVCLTIYSATTLEISQLKGQQAQETDPDVIDNLQGRINSLTSLDVIDRKLSVVLPPII